MEQVSDTKSPRAMTWRTLDKQFDFVFTQKSLEVKGRNVVHFVAATANGKGVGSWCR